MAYLQQFGALPSKYDIRDYVACVSAPVEYPEEFALDMCEAKNQGAVSSCVAHAIAAVVEYYNRLQEGEYVKMSTGYIYGNRTNMSHKGQGMYVSDAVKNTVKYGDVENALFSYNVEVPQAIEEFEKKAFELSDRAFPNRFSSYFVLPTVASMKANLMQNGPIIFSIPWYADIKVTAQNIMTHDTSNKTIDGYHCMVIYGWCKDGWLIQNSWGKGWGKNGRAIMPYSFRIMECYGVTDEISEKLNQEKLEALINTNKEYAERIEEYTTKIQQLNDAIVQKDAQYEQVTITMNQIIKQLDETELYNDRLEQRYDEIKNTLSNIEEQKAKLQKEYEASKEELDKYIELNKEQQTTIDALNQKIIEIEKPYANWNSTFVKIINWIVNLFKKRK